MYQKENIYIKLKKSKGKKKKKKKKRKEDDRTVTTDQQWFKIEIYLKEKNMDPWK